MLVDTGPSLDRRLTVKQMSTDIAVDITYTKHDPIIPYPATPEWKTIIPFPATTE